MSTTIHKFYNIFFQNAACYNLFLLSKEELLDTNTLGSEENQISFSTNKIIISNSDQISDHDEAIRFRIESYDIELEESLGKKIEFFEKVIRDFFDKKLKKSFDKLGNDLEDNFLTTVLKLVRIVFSEKKRDDRILNLLHEYNFVPQNLDSMEKVQDHFLDMIKPSKKSDLTNEQNIKTFFEGLKFAKELYVNQSYKKLYESNQVLVNSYYAEDSFSSRLVMFNFLFEAEVLLPSKEDAFVECCHCLPNTYRGVFQLKLSPNKLKNLICPVCSNSLTYYVPYILHEDVYSIVKEQDGLLLNAFSYFLAKNSITHELDKHYLGDVQIDCLIQTMESIYFVEAKMYKVNTTESKLKSKIREHYGKLLKDTERLVEAPDFRGKNTSSLLLININDNRIIDEMNQELSGNDAFVIEIHNLASIKAKFVSETKLLN